MSVPMNWRLKSREVVVYRELSADEPVRPREMGVPSDGGEEAVQECHHCMRSRHKQSKMSTMPQAMQPVVRGVSIVSKIQDVCHHT